MDADAAASRDQGESDFLDLLARYFDGQLTPGEVERLNDQLRVMPERRETFVRFCLQGQSLAEMLAPQKAEPPLGGRIAPAGAPAEAGDPPSPDPRPPVLGFLGDLGRRGWEFFGDHALLMSLLLMLALGILGAIAGMSFLDRHPVEVATGVSPLPPGERQGEGIPNPKSKIQNDPGYRVPESEIPAPQSPIPHPSTVARLTRANACRWDRSLAPVEPGQRLFAGQSLGLRSGVAEILFDVGATVILQGPATLKIESGMSARLGLGKATTQITRLSARGFEIHTPQATFVDQGTEFGVEVTPGGSSRVHVFQGCVDVAIGGSGKAQRLMENAGARFEGDSPSMTFMEDTGESFIRSMDESGRNPHVVAYWRFEDRPLGMLLPHSEGSTRNVRATTDSSFNGNDLFTHSPSTQPYFSGDVPAAVVPQTGAPNRGCLNNSTPPTRESPARDVYTRSAFSHAAPLDIQKITPARWTIEASVKPARLRCGCQTFVVRDGSTHPNLRTSSGIPARLTFQITAEDRFAVRFRDVDNRACEAVATEITPQANHWYHVAATSDGRALRLYVDALDGRGYQLRRETALPRIGSTALGKGGDDCQWSIGRGDAKGRPAEWFQGSIDEVRVSDVALHPAEFLFAPK